MIFATHFQRKLEQAPTGNFQLFTPIEYILRLTIFLSPAILISFIVIRLYKIAIISPTRQISWKEKFLFIFQSFCFFWMPWHILLLYETRDELEIYYGTLFVSGYCTMAAIMVLFWVCKQPVRTWFKICITLMVLILIVVPQMILVFVKLGLL